MILSQIPATSGTPMNWKGFPYGRTGGSLVSLSSMKVEQIKTTTNCDWSRQIIENATIDNLDIDKVMLLDRVQKKYSITKEQSDYLKKANLIEGRYPNVYISSTIAQITDDKEGYIYNRGLENEFYKNLILKYIKEYGQANRKEIKNLLMDKLPSSLSEKNKISRVRYLLNLLKKENKIYYDMSTWKLKE